MARYRWRLTSSSSRQRDIDDDVGGRQTGGSVGAEESGREEMEKKSKTHSTLVSDVK